MLLELDRPEFELVTATLERAMGDLREEIYKCEVAEFEVQLKAREAILNRILQRLAAANASGLVEGEPASRR